MTDEEGKVQSMMAWASANGYAIAIFTPDELGGAKAGRVEAQMVEAGWDAIDVLRDLNPSEPENQP